MGLHQDSSHQDCAGGLLSKLPVMWEMGQREAPDQKTNLESQQTVMLGGPSCWKEKTVNVKEMGTSSCSHTDLPPRE